jgi:hypothetical protein
MARSLRPLGLSEFIDEIESALQNNSVSGSLSRGDRHYLKDVALVANSEASRG